MIKPILEYLQARKSAVVAVLVMVCGVSGGIAAWADGDKAFSYDPKGIRDPFVPLVRDGRFIGAAQPSRRVSATLPVLYGILWDPGGVSIALLNDMEAQVGDSVAGYKVVEIRPEAVVLTDGTEPMILTISYDLEESESPGGTTMGGE